AEALRRRNFTSIAGSVHQASFATDHTSAGHGLPVLNEEGNLASPEADNGSWISGSSSSEWNKYFAVDLYSCVDLLWFGML
ncbi:peroxisome biogenesis factor 10-like, partial [Trifolium medium]|nr:peroxisome biogenesis factor 10-like [Trifolium medium]